MQILPKITVRIGTALAILLMVQGCSEKSFSLNEETSNNPSIGLEPTKKSGDRPTESGTGVPGYLVDCSPYQLHDDDVQVGCMTTTSNGARVLNALDAWDRYDIRLPDGSPAGIKVARRAASNPAAWDVSFTFQGADKATLATVARNSLYGYTYQDADGRTYRVETAAPPPPVAVETPAAGNTGGTPSCLGGARLDDVCFVPVESSCTEYCAQSGMAPHPYIFTKFGSEARDSEAKSDEKEEACHNLFATIRAGKDFTFEDRDGRRGLGCYEESGGRVIFDESPTRADAFPRIGDRRICGCQ